MGGTRPMRFAHRLPRLAEVAGWGALAAAGQFALVRGAAGAPAPREPARAAVASTPARRQLDLSLPPLQIVFTRAELAALTAQPQADTGMQDVTVRTPPYQIEVPAGPFRALAWAIMHPLDAWRILAPVPGE